MHKRSFQHPQDEKGKFGKVCGCILHNCHPANDHSSVKTSCVNNRRSYKDLVADGYIERWATHTCKSCLGFKKQQKEKETKKKMKIWRLRWTELMTYLIL